ncbi:MAG: aspartate aminotransferase family protein [Lachnospiraceae bacterium]|nr:aspartate aminotransferase family protein [Lachnospiraceae bacterium]
MGSSKEIMDHAEQALIHTYNRFPVVLDHGDGVFLYDAEGRKYLDFYAGIAVNALGYNVKEFNDAVKAQVDKLVHVSNLFYTEPLANAANKLVKATGLEKVFFTNSGTEAIEGAMKVARKYAFMKDGNNRDHEIIAMNGSFHGRSLGALSVTGNQHYQEAFKPLIDKIVFADFNNTEDVISKMNDNTCAVLLETIQGEGGIYPADPDFLKAVREECSKRAILLILDEIQCGMGRSGKMFAYEHYGILPDIMTTAKALGCGIPVGAFVVGEKACKALVPGDHGSTYGGNPLATAAANAVFDLFEKYNILGNVNEVGDYLGKVLEGLKEKHSCVTDVRGMGLIRGMELSVPVGPVVSKCIERGLLVISAENNVIRFVPPLVIGKEHVDMMAGILDGVLNEV